MMNKLHLIVLLCILMSLSVSSQAQSLSESLSDFAGFISNAETLDMHIDMHVLDEKKKRLESTTVEFKRDNKFTYNRMKDLQILQDDDEEILVSIDNARKTITIGRLSEGIGLQRQMESIFQAFDQLDSMMQVEMNMSTKGRSFTAYVNEEKLVSYLFDNSNSRLKKVVFYQSEPLYVEGKKIETSVEIIFRYQSKVNAPRLSQILKKVGESWEGRGKYSSFEIQDLRKLISNY